VRRKQADLYSFVHTNYNMPGLTGKPPDKKPARRREKPNEVPKLPLTDSVDWRKRILQGSYEERDAAISEAYEKKDTRALDALFEVLKRKGELEEHLSIWASCVIGHIGVTKEQLEILIRMFTQGTREERDIGCYTLSELACKEKESLLPLFPEFVRGLEDEDDNVVSNSANILGTLGDKRAVPALIRCLENFNNNEKFEDGVISDVSLALGQLGDKSAIEPLKKCLWTIRHTNIFDAKIEIRNALEKLGLSKGDIERFERDVDHSLELEPPQKAVYDLLRKNRDTKRLIFEKAEVLSVLPDKQAWLTINDPSLAKDALKAVLEKLGEKRGGLDNAFAATLGVRSGQLEDVHFTYYADEILDAIAQIANASGLVKDPSMKAILSGIRYNERVKLRYIRREMSDLSLGDKCGDCTAKGSINFSNSISWLVNPAYQILKMSKGKHFIGRINFTIGKIAGQEAIIIDALEFNPQAQKGKPYHQDALECFESAVGFLKELAEKENRTLFAFAFSNSSGAVELLNSWGESVEDAINKEEVAVSLIVPVNDVKRILSSVGYMGGTRLFYQMIEDNDFPGGWLTAIVGKDLTDSKLPTLERDVINPAQISDEAVAAAMRARDFIKASSLILAKPELDARIKSIFGLPAQVQIGPAFLNTKLKKIYKAEAVDAESLWRTFRIKAGKFVRL